MNSKYYGDSQEIINNLDLDLNDVVKIVYNIDCNYILTVYNTVIKVQTGIEKEILTNIKDINHHGYYKLLYITNDNEVGVISNSDWKIVKYGQPIDMVVSDHHSLLFLSNSKLYKSESLFDDFIEIDTDIKIVKITSGIRHFFALSDEDKLYVWGSNFVGRLGTENLEDSAELPTLLLDDVKEISTSGNHSLVILNNGSVFSWGDNEYNQTGVDEERINVPTILDLSNVSDIGVGHLFGLALVDTFLYVWGSLDFLGHKFKNVKEPKMYSNVNGIKVFDMGFIVYE